MNIRETTVSVAGVPVVVRTDSAVGDEVIAELLGARSPTNSTAALTVDVAVGTAVVPGRPPDVSVMELRAWRDATRVMFAADDVVATVESSHATVVGPAANSRGRCDRSGFMCSAISWRWPTCTSCMARS